MKVYKFDPAVLAHYIQLRETVLSELRDNINLDTFKELSKSDVDSRIRILKNCNKQIGFQRYLRNLPDKKLEK